MAEKKTYTKKHLVITSVLTVIATVIAIFGLAILNNARMEAEIDKVRAEAGITFRKTYTFDNDEEIDINFYLQDGLLTEDMENYLVHTYIPAISEYFNYTAIKVDYSESIEKIYITLLPTDESVSQIVGNYMQQAPDKMSKYEFMSLIIDPIAEATSKLSTQFRHPIDMEIIPDDSGNVLLSFDGERIDNFFVNFFEVDADTYNARNGFEEMNRKLRNEP